MLSLTGLVHASRPAMPSFRLTRRDLVRFAVIFAAWTAAGLLIAAQTALQLRARGETGSLASIIARSLVSVWIWALYTPGIVVIARRVRRLRMRHGDVTGVRGWAPFLAAHFLIAAVGSVADSAVWAAVRPLIDGVVQPWPRVFAFTLLINVTWYVAVVALAEAVDYAAHARERERAAAALARRAEALRERLDDARLRTLESQLQPHFLFNTLNLIAELVHNEPEVADEMLTHLGVLLRRSFHETPHVVPLREEVSFVSAYAEILARRYHDRVTVSVTIAAGLEAHPVPAFLLQPLVENAFRHGVERRESVSTVEVSAVARGQSLVVQVCDRDLQRGQRAWSPSVEAALAEEPATLAAASLLEGCGVGLGNTRERLELLYGGASGLTLLRTAGATVATVWLPLDARPAVSPAVEAKPSEVPAWA